MPPSVLRWFEYQDQLGWKTPPEFNYYEVLGEVLSRKARIEHLLGVRLGMDTSVQDASFFTELTVLDPCYYDPVKGGAIVQTIAVRFSAFDRMVTVFGAEEEKYQNQLPALIDMLENANYAYVDYELLQWPYTGMHACSSTSQWTWFTRFFDYL